MAATFPKLLVLSSSLPGTRHGGGVIQDEILRRYPRDRYACFAIHLPEWQDGRGERPASLKDVPVQTGPLLPPLRLRGVRLYLPVLRFLGYRLLSPWRIRQAVAFGRRHGVELVWAELQGETLVLAVGVAAGLQVPLVGTIWDDPDGWLTDGRYDVLSRRLLLRRFREALRLARQVSTVSEAMQEAYRQEYGLESLILRYGHDLAEGVASPPVNSPRQAVTVGFAGNVYGEDAWRAFLAACARLNAQGGLPAIKVVLFGGERFPYPHPGVEVACQGWLPRGEMLRRLAAVDFCYLPYWFAANKRRHAELSFPTKLTTYVAAGRPVLYHGPEYAGATRLMRDWRLGLCIYSLKTEDIAAAVERLAVDEPLRQSCQEAAQTAFRAEFNASQMLRSFATLVDASPSLFHTVTQDDSLTLA